VCASAAVTAQGFTFEQQRKKKISIPIKVISNLVLIPVKVNGVELTFLLDTGVEETVLFSLQENEEVNFFDVKKVKLSGFGDAEALEGLKSSGNKVSLAGYSDTNHDIYIVLDQNFNFSSQLGIPVNGIIGYNFFARHPVEIDYDQKRLTIYNRRSPPEKRLKGFAAFDIKIDQRKPYLDIGVTMAGKAFQAKMLIDNGNSDALWFFPEKSSNIQIPEKRFEDFLGSGFSGEIHGVRGRIDKVAVGGFAFREPLVAFPNPQMSRNIDMVKDRVGSIGGEIFKRFDVVFDYPNQKMYLKANRDLNAPFDYNMSGIEIQHSGMVWVSEKMELLTEKRPTSSISVYENPSDAFRYKFSLKPTYTILSIRPGSPAEHAGLQKGDIITSINGTPAYKYALSEINAMMKAGEGRTIQLGIDRKGAGLKFKFKLKKLL
jgi:hypothetical protein